MESAGGERRTSAAVAFWGMGWSFPASADGDFAGWSCYGAGIGESRMELWDNLVKNALVGTERLTPSLPTGEAGIDALMGKLGGTEKERALLAAAGALACARRAGYMPQQLDETHLPKPLEGD